MCGISAILNSNKETPKEPLRRMTEQLSHRGPDANGYMYFPGCHLGHTRLSIIDLETGAQPMCDTSGRYCITFNGEIYNYQQLREQLAVKGYRFSTHSDTEVIIAAYDEWGSGCLDYFRGMFAFVIWDTQDRKLFAARDLFGEKPLYYSIVPDGSMLLASEIKSLIASGLLQPRLDHNAVDAYLALSYVPPDRTIYENIQTLPPGHCMRWQNGNLTVEQYWSPKLDTRQITLDDAAEQLQQLFHQAVRRQMVADVPVGAFLSGGLDSSTIVALMQKQSAEPIKTFSVGFGNYINELPYARAVADFHKTQHYEIDLGTPNVAEMLERMASVYDEPFADSSHIPTYLISEYARKQVKVVLSGDGGDELFGGYWWYPALALSGKMSRSWFKWVTLRIISKLLKHRLKNLYLSSSALGLATRWPDMWTRNVMSNIHFKPHQRRKLWAGNNKNVKSFIPNDYYKPSIETSGVNRGFYFDLTSYLPGDILVKVDRAAMAHGLETRAPFLDRDLVEFALSLPETLKVDGHETKVLLRQACMNSWPKELRSRDKQGFGAPCDVWLGFPKVKSLTAHVFASGSPLRRLLPGIKARQQHTLSYQTWILLTLGLWLERQRVTV
jgi:asparagine synthase (glutamine-hydrolysing)